jgi:glycosyltransferase involved in cell wall biosynthesis
MPGKDSYQPLVSVIIPNYNHAPYLKQRIDSVLDQTYQNYEVIILDDKSTDESLDIIETYRSHPKVVLIEYNEVNSGSTFRQWKKGLDLAKGEWIWIAESDDVADERFLEKSAHNFKGTDLIYCNSNIIDENGDPIELYGFTNMPYKLSYSDFQQNFVIKGHEFVEKWLTADNFIPNASAVLFKRSLLNMAILKRDIFKDITQMKLMGDWYFWIILAHHSTYLAYLEEPLNHFRNHSNNVRSRTIKQSFTEMHFILALLRGLKVDDKKTVSTYLFRFFNRNNKTSFSSKEKVKLVLDSFKYNFFGLLLKSILKKPRALLNRNI